MPDLTVAARVVRGVMEFAVAKGAGRRELAARCGIDRAELEDPENRVALEKYLALIRAAKELCGDPAFALHFGEEVDLSELSLIGQIGSPSASMADDLEQLNRYAPLDIDFGNGGERFRMMNVDGHLWMVDDRPDPDDSPEITESFFARAVCGMRRWFGEKPLVRAVHVTYAQPAYVDEYDRVFRMRVVFGSDRNALLLSDDAWATFKSALPPARYASGVLTAHAEALLEKLRNSKSMRGRVETLLAPLLRTGDATMETVASRLGVSRQTLFRKLKAEGATFEKVLDELRHKLALHYLDEKKTSVNETAYLLGFSDPGAFSRAFKRWTGSSPGAMRGSHGEGDPGTKP